MDPPPPASGKGTARARIPGPRVTTNGATSLAWVPILRLFLWAHPLQGTHRWYTGPRVLTDTHSPRHTARARTKQATQDAGQGTHALSPSDVNKPRTPGSRAPVQGLFSPSHVRALTAPGPASADADARQPARPLPAGFRRLPAGAPRRGPPLPPRPELASAPFRSPRPLLPPPATTRQLSGRRVHGGTDGAGPGAPPQARPKTRRPCRLGAPRARLRPGPTAPTHLSARSSWRPGLARVPLLSGLLSRPAPSSVSPPVPTAGRSQPDSRERRAEFCCGAGSAVGRSEL